jgi:two-component system, NarL family, response regulator LiaR
VAASRAAAGVTRAERIRVLIVDDHAVVRSGLATFLQAFEDFELVGEAGDGSEALRLCAQVAPHIVLMDLLMPEMDGIAATRAIRQHHPETQVIALTSFQDQDRVQAAIDAGALGYLLKNVSADDLARAIRSARAGRPTLAPEATQALMHAARQLPAPGHDLTPREREVLALMARGLNNAEIAKRLVVNRSTAKFHVSNILTKLGAASRTEAVALALTHHLVPGRERY